MVPMLADSLDKKAKRDALEYLMFLKNKTLW
jgi:hypothetical protein